ncbi:extracellular solute-binding protein [Paenibacillus sp. UMB4589-SE434]|uniref:ABC transporter substrate-binding protein n=1 Tax=Paenibacillus sp. UMB4589-SE434 TaxID=3046314 RepID=UPI00254DA2DB|nr:extracellular solute-binding protein [Paenibacillus sp. UMB4589-SE434]MDK8179950.1 extracellular solute-binding protein [Paenibacillus sp. UMB4589-SE434]
MNKKWLLLFIIAMLSITACTSNHADPVSNSSPSPEAGGKKTVVVSVLHVNPFLETVVEKFEALHPDIHIELKSYPISGGLIMTGLETEKYVQSVLTEAMSGKGADLIDMRNLPEDKLVDKQVLANLNDLMTNDSSFDRQQYFQNIFQSPQGAEGLYSMPVNLMLDMMVGKPDLLKKVNANIDDGTWTWEQLKDITKKVQVQQGKEIYAFAGLPPEMIMSYFLEDSYREFVLDNQQANFDSNEFRSLMQNIKAMYDEGLINANDENQEGMSTSGDGNKNSLFSYTGSNRAETLLSKLVDSNSQMFQRPTISGQPRGWTYKSSNSFGMNRNSKVQKEAWEFLKFMLTEEVQASDYMMGIPLHKGANEKKLQEAAQKLAATVPDAKLLEEQIQYAQKVLETAHPSFSIDKKIETIVQEEFDSYMNGQKSVEEVSKLIQNRVSTYLNE